MSLLDSFSALHNYKQRHGLEKVDTDSVSAYILECRLRRMVNAHLDNCDLDALARESGLTRHRIRELREHKLLDLQKPDLAEAIALIENEGLAACLQFIHRL